MSGLSIVWDHSLQRYVVDDAQVGCLRFFPTLHEAECWVIAEQERREMEPGATA